jgi:hypothetical protein
MNQISSTDWNRGTLRELRLRLGWCKSDLARRLHCSSLDIDMWEEGAREIEAPIVSELELLLRQAEAVSEEIKHMPLAENQCDLNELEQIDFDRVKEVLE